MAGEKKVSNIQKYNESLSPEERKAHQKKAGQASGRARRKYRDMRDTLQQLMARDIDDVEGAETLRELGLAPSVANAVGLSVVKRALKGEVTAVKFLRDTLEENQEEAGRDIRSLDLSRFSDEELAALADRQEDTG